MLLVFHFIVALGLASAQTNISEYDVINETTTAGFHVTADDVTVDAQSTRDYLQEHDTRRSDSTDGFLTTTDYDFDSTSSRESMSVPVNFYPFGVNNGDRVERPDLDELKPISMKNGFPFYGSRYTSFDVSVTGTIYFGHCTPSLIQLGGLARCPMIFPFSSPIDPNLNYSGRLYYRSSTDPILLDRASRDVQNSFSVAERNFRASWVFVATWHNITYNVCNKQSPSMTFQLVLITDGVKSMALFNYDQLQRNRGDGNFRQPSVQAGFSAGDSARYFLLPNSGTSNVLHIISDTNICMSGRWLYRIDGNSIIGPNNKCKPIAFGYPILEGPIVIKRRWVEFYCVIPKNETLNEEVAFNITFLFNEEQGPWFIVRPSDLRATLHERHLTNKRLGKWISCQAVSFWIDFPSFVSKPQKSRNPYWAGIQVSPTLLHVTEGDTKPVLLKLKSTIPITCPDEDATGKGKKDTCQLTLRISASRDLLIRKKGSGECSHTLREIDWNVKESAAFRMEESIEIFAKIDSFMFWPARLNTLSIDIGNMPEKKTIEGETYKNMWNRHRLPEITVYHYDSPNGFCRSTGDPHVSTFDYFWYTIYPSGQFTYVRTTRGYPIIEIQVRHKPCGWGVSCVCGVALRENDVILGADMCKGNRLRYITNKKQLPKGAEIRKDANGYSFEIILPSTVRAVAYVNRWSWTFTLDMYVTSSEFERVEGLCGSFDQNLYNDLRANASNSSEPINLYLYRSYWWWWWGYTYSPKSVDKVVESWRVPLNQSLFDGVISYNYPNTSSNDNVNPDLCRCESTGSSCGQSLASSTLSAHRMNDIVTPEVMNAKNTVSRSKRSAQSEEEDSSMMNDDAYDSSWFNFSDPQPSPNTVNGSWPGINNVTEQDAIRHCQSVLWNDSAVRNICEEIVNITDVNAVIDKCITDIRLTGDLSWADDKIPEIQDLCVFEAITTNLSQSQTNASLNGSSDFIENITNQVLAIFNEISSVVCFPQDCSKHGDCQNGTCVCAEGYMGPDCALSKDTVPLLHKTLGRRSQACDVIRSPCQKIEILADKVTASPNLTCKVDVKKVDDSKESFLTNASVVSWTTTICNLPTDNFQIDLQSESEIVTTTIGPEVEKDFYSLPPGNPVLHYTISISNNGEKFSNGLKLAVYNSKCISCDGGLCSQKSDACLINGHCFKNGERNPYNHEYICNPPLSSNTWIKLSGHDVTVAVTIVVTAVAVILTVLAVFFVIRRR